jgi:hypothetical protein
MVAHNGGTAVYKQPKRHNSDQVDVYCVHPIKLCNDAMSTAEVIQCEMTMTDDRE